MRSQGYQFVTVDGCGVNAFFVDPSAFCASFVENLEGESFRSNRSPVRSYGADWQDHFAKIRHLELVEL